MNDKTFAYHRPTEFQLEVMDILRDSADKYCRVLEEFLPDGPDKTFVIRAHRTNAMWANVALTRLPDGEPRD